MHDPVMNAVQVRHHVTLLSKLFAALWARDGLPLEVNHLFVLYQV